MPEQNNEDATPPPAHNPAEHHPPARHRYTGGLDYWDFVGHVRERLAGESPESDHSATAVMLAFVRGATSFTHSMESLIHRPAGRSWASYQLLYTLWLAGDMHPSEAATLAGMSRATVSTLTGKMVEQGALERIPAPEDGRSHILHLTEQGVEEIRGLYEKQNLQETRWANTLTSEERSILLMLMDKLLGGATASESRRRN